MIVDFRLVYGIKVVIYAYRGLSKLKVCIPTCDHTHPRGKLSDLLFDNIDTYVG